jgi:Papain family cysteine protease
MLRKISAIATALVALSLSASASAAPLHGMGLLRPTPHMQLTKAPENVSLPSSASLTQFAMPVGDQGQIGSCASWATVYSAMGYWENKDAIPPPGPGGEPMYAYSQISHGVDNGSTIEAPLDIAKTQGIDSRADYFQGDFDFRDQPTAHERANALHWRSQGYTELHLDQITIEAAISSGHPVVLGIPVYEDFWKNQNIDPSGVYPASGNSRGNFEGNHAIAAMGYDSTGVVIENSWSTDWGNRGYATLRWSWLLSHDGSFQATQVNDMNLSPPPPPPKTFNLTFPRTTRLASKQSVTISVTVDGKAFSDGDLDTLAQLKVGNGWANVGHTTGDRNGKLKLSFSFARTYKGKVVTLRAYGSCSGFRPAASNTMEVRVM